MKHNQILLITLLLIVSSCYRESSSNDNSSGGDVYNNSLADDNSDNIDIMIPLKLATEHLGNDYEDMFFKIAEESEDLIEIEPSSGYYNNYISNTRMIPEIHEFLYTDFLIYPRLRLYIENNMDQPISISSLDIVVSESEIDPLPYIYIEPLAVGNALTLWNESWCDWGTMTLSYSLLTKGESFNGHYENSINIPYFTGIVYVDLLNDLRKKGYNEQIAELLDDNSEFASIFGIDFGQSIANAKIVGKDCSLEHLKKGMGILPYDFRFEENESLYAPFEYGMGLNPYIFARLYGKLSFSKSNFTKEFRTDINLSYAERSAGAMDLSDSFDVNLKPVGEDYAVQYPYTTTIPAGQTEMVQVIIKCPQSAIHKFYVRINNNNELNIRTKDIQLHLLNSRHSTKQPSVMEMYSEFEDE